jgi:hypothetical protein
MTTGSLVNTTLSGQIKRKLNVEICALLGYNAASSSNPFFKGQEVQEFLLFLDFLILEDGTDTLSRNVGKGLRLDAELYPRGAQISSALRRKPEITKSNVTFRGGF